MQGSGQGGLKSKPVAAVPVLQDRAWLLVPSVVTWCTRLQHHPFKFGLAALPSCARSQRLEQGGGHSTAGQEMLL